jgi:hypothetical protein
MKQTAVEFAFEELNKWRVETFGEFALIGIPQEVLDKAKEMEKQQMRDASCPYVGGWEDDEFEEYYNKTYKQVTNKK